MEGQCVMDSKQAKNLGRLAELAKMKREAELAKLAAVAQSRARLQESLATLRNAEAPLDPDEQANDPAMIRARMAHRRWGEAQQRRLNQQLAMVTADWLRQKPAAAKAFGRAAVLNQLTEQAWADIKAEKAKPN